MLKLTWQAVADVVVDLVHTGGSVLALGELALVDVDLTVLAFESSRTVALVVSNKVLAGASVDTRIFKMILVQRSKMSETLTRFTFVDFILAHLPSEANVTLTEEISDFVLTGGVVFARIDLGNRSCKMYSLF